ncbi:hypothetical protein [Saccharothrix carnea]|uniref:hypothetical protein n=1 Tax=Saccharothrix carnea TaxID=1280637 RepID=UPI000D0DB372|nr:hypothetical protein [Saccharothrix carnea]
MLTATVAATAALTGTAQAATTMTDLGTIPGASWSIARAVNNSGVAVGRSSGNGWSRATRWAARATITDLGVLPGGRYSNATGINSTGVIAGDSEVSDGTNRAVRFNLDGTITDLGLVPGHSDSWGLGIDDSGTVVGEGWDRSTGNRRAVKWDAAGVLTEFPLPAGTTSSLMGGVAPNGIAAGSVYAGQLERAVRWNLDGTVTVLASLPGGGDTRANAVNRYGQVAGYAFTIDGGQHAVRWTRDGRIVDLGAANPYGSIARGINENGITVGSAQDSTGQSVPTRWDSNGASLGLGLPATAYTGTAWAINRSGVIVGNSGQYEPNRALRWIVG